MTEITPELQALADAALEVSGYPTMGTMPWDRFDHAVKAYRATQAPKDCRPPNSAKDGSYRHLQGDLEIHIVGRWYAGGWDTFSSRGQDHTSPEGMAKLGWTVHSEVKFGEPAGVVAMEVTVNYQTVLDWLTPKYEPKHYTLGMLSVLINKAIRHFRAPKLEISDEEIRELACIHCSQYDVPGGERFSFQGPTLSSFARAVIAKVGGEK